MWASMQSKTQTLQKAHSRFAFRSKNLGLRLTTLHFHCFFNKTGGTETLGKVLFKKLS